MSREEKFLPPGVIVVFVVLLLWGLGLAAIATPLLGLRKGFTITMFGAELYTTKLDSLPILPLLLKELVALFLCWHAVRLLFLDEEARRRIIFFAVIFGIAAPLLMSADVWSIDWVFVAVLRVGLFAVSSVVIWYLMRPRTLQYFTGKGLVGHFVYRYCPVCGVTSPDSELQCEHCETALLDRFETDEGLVFARTAHGSDTPSPEAA